MASPDDRDFGDPTRRTYLAEERTLLAWWRSGLAALAVALAVGRLLPALLDERNTTGFIALGAGFALVGVVLILMGGLRHRAVERALAQGRFRSMPAAVTWGITVAMLVLAAGTLILVVTET
jgi:putative membrane protein